MTFFKNLKNKIASAASASAAVRKLGLVPAAPDNAQTHGFAHRTTDIPSDDNCSDFCAVISIPEDADLSDLAVIHTYMALTTVALWLRDQKKDTVLTEKRLKITIGSLLLIIIGVASCVLCWWLHEL